MFDEKLVEVANQLIAHCRAGTESDGLDTLYAHDCVSIEAVTMPGGADRTSTGLSAIRAKHEWWDANTEVHSFEAEGPFFHDPDRFAVIFSAEITNEAMGGRSSLREVAIYTVKDGKIVREEFFFNS
ncbi:nuclear transport factor 2 family protein [Rhodobacteraceae bacterium NNCM2]|nr:nuclear transport factor 2 family protein [Coraliihabitans acroporae]